MSSRLSPSATSKVCSSPSLSTKVTLRSSPGLGASRWPCSKEDEEEKGRLERDCVEGAIERRLDWYGDCGMADLSGDEVEMGERSERVIDRAAHLEAATDIVKD
jgi:hypothetical protein